MIQQLYSVVIEEHYDSIYTGVYFFICKQFSLEFAAVWGGPRTCPLSQENKVQNTKLRLKKCES